MAAFTADVDGDVDTTLTCTDCTSGGNVTRCVSPCHKVKAAPWVETPSTSNVCPACGGTEDKTDKVMKTRMEVSNPTGIRQRCVRGMDHQRDCAHDDVDDA